MAVTDPWAADTPALLPFTLGQDATVTATGPGGFTRALEVQSGTVKWDEATAPRCTASVTARVPEDQAVLDALDPRTGVRLHITAGYIRPGDAVDVHEVADLQLTHRAVSRPGNTLALDAAGAESKVIDAAGPVTELHPSTTSVPAAALAILTDALGAAPVVTVNTLPATAPSAPPLLQPEQDYWAAVDDLVDRVGGDVYDDGLNRWRLELRPTLAGTPAHELVVGLRGTLLTSDAALDRRGWFNAVQLVYRWTTTENVYVGNDSSGVAQYESREVPHLVVGTAAVTTGPRSITASGRVVFRDTRDVATSQTDANKAAAAVLARKVSLGRSLSLSAIAAWWLRPGHTVAVTLPTGPRELHLLSSVAFDLGTGRMSLTTRRPDDDSTITQGA